VSHQKNVLVLYLAYEERPEGKSKLVDGYDAKGSSRMRHEVIVARQITVLN